jgi:F-type H+-transporting ATPase subunit a
MMGPVFAMSIIILPVEVISLFLRPFTLGMRLTGVMSGDHLMVQIFEHLLLSWNLPFLPLPAILKGLGLVIGFVQAYVFAILSIVYVKLSIIEPH